MTSLFDPRRRSDRAPPDDDGRDEYSKVFDVRAFLPRPLKHRRDAVAIARRPQVNTVMMTRIRRVATGLEQRAIRSEQRRIIGPAPWRR